MIHARPDYSRIQDPAGLIPHDEPVFLIRAKDMNAPRTLLVYADIAQRNGASEEFCDLARSHAVLMLNWQKQHGKKVPDAPLPPTAADLQPETK